VDKPPPAAGDRYAVRTVLAFEVVQGNTAFEANAKRRVTGAIMIVNAGAGTFEWAPADSRTDVYPVQGKVTLASGGVSILSGERRTGEGVTFARAIVGGTLDVSGSEPVAELTLTTETSVNTAIYRAKVVLQRT
jgi:hypothetical protein